MLLLLQLLYFFVTLRYCVSVFNPVIFFKVTGYYERQQVVEKYLKAIDHRYPLEQVAGILMSTQQVGAVM